MKNKVKWLLAALAVVAVIVAANVTAGMELYATWWALVPPVLAIGLALITKEVYSSLLIGIVSGALLALRICSLHMKVR